MQAKIVFIVLAFFSVQASAEWELITFHDKSLLYLDLSTKRQQGRYTLVWDMMELYKAEGSDGESYNSVKTLTVYNCSEFTTGIKSIFFYSGKMGSGEIVGNSSKELHQVEFKDVVPSTMGEDAFKKVCDI